MVNYYYLCGSKFLITNKKITMKRFSFLTILLAVALICNAQKPVQLRLNLPKGQTFEQNMEVKMTMKMEMMGMNIDSDMPFSAKISYKMVDIQNGNFVLECTYEEMKMSMDIMGQKMNFDSSSKEQDLDNDPFAKVFSSFLGKTFTMTLDKFKNVVAIEGMDKIIASILENAAHSKEQKAQMEGMVKGMFGEEKFKENFALSNVIFPQKKVKKGFTWATETSQSLQGITGMQVKNQFKVENITENTVEISSVSSYSINLSVNEGGQDVKVKMKDAKATGTYVIDTKTGWTVSSTTNADMQMVMTTGEMEVPTQIIMEIVVK